MNEHRDAGGGARTLGGLIVLLVASGFLHPALDARSPTPPSQPTSGPTPSLPSAETVFNRYLEATGGRAAHERIRTLIAKGDFEVPAADVRGSVTVYHQPPDKVVQIITSPQTGTTRLGYDGETAWRVLGTGEAKILEGADRSSLIRDAMLTAELHGRKAFVRAECVAVQDVDGRPCYKLDLGAEDQVVMTRFYNVETNLLSVMTLSRLTPLGAFKVHIEFSDYRRVGGILMPHRLTHRAQSDEQVVTYTSIVANADLPKDAFELPDEIRVLKKAQSSVGATTQPTTRPKSQ